MFTIITKHNRQIFWQNNYWLIGVLIFNICLSVILKLMNQPYTRAYKGAIQITEHIFVPHIWLALILIPFLAIGHKARVMIKEYYVHLHAMPLITYVCSVLQIVSEMTFYFWIIPILILQPVDNWPFALATLGYLVLMTTIYSLGALFIKPIYVFEILLVLFLSCIAQNDFPILSQLMSVRFDPSYGLIAFHYLVLILVLYMLIKQVKNIDFLTT